MCVFNFTLRTLLIHVFIFEPPASLKDAKKK